MVDFTKLEWHANKNSPKPCNYRAFEPYSKAKLRPLEVILKPNVQHRV